MNLTKEKLFVFNQIQNRFEKNLVHMLNIDELPFLLEKNILEKNTYISFSKLFPVNFAHGCVAIVFNRSKIRKKYKLIDIEYTKEYMNKHPDIKNHVFKGLQSKKATIKTYKEMINRYKNLFQTPETKHNISNCRILIKEIEKDYITVMLDSMRYENEILIRKKVFKFDIDDVFCIIYPSISFLEYYPINKIYHEKLFFIEDYFPINYKKESLLSLWYNHIIHIFTEYRNDFNNPNRLRLPLLYYYVYGIAMGMKQYSIPNTAIKISDNVDFMLKYLPTIKNVNAKTLVEHDLIITHLYSNYIKNNVTREELFKKLEEIKGMNHDDNSN